MAPEDAGRRRRRWRRALALLALGLLLAFFATHVAVGRLLAPAPKPVGAPPAELGCESLELRDRAGRALRGWYARAGRGADAVLLLHGLRASRRQMLARMRWLQSAGFASAAIDLLGHGESDGEQMSFGWHEASGVRAALDELRRRGHARVGVIGHSLGAASSLLGEPANPPRADVYVLEAMYPELDTALRNRLEARVGALASFLTPLVLRFGRLRVDFELDELRPIRRARALRAPTLVVSGSEDTRTTPGDTRRIFEALAGPKELFFVEGAAHVDLHAFAPARYEERVGAFLRAHGLRSASR